MIKRLPEGIDLRLEQPPKNRRKELRRMECNLVAIWIKVRPFRLIQCTSTPHPFISKAKSCLAKYRCMRIYYNIRSYLAVDSHFREFEKILQIPLNNCLLLHLFLRALTDGEEKSFRQLIILDFETE